MLEECALPYKIIPVNLRAGEQMTPEFLAINPNNKVPVIVDRDAAVGTQTIFESGAILSYLAEKTGKYFPNQPKPRMDCMEWLFWQAAELGPSTYQLFYFKNRMEEKIPAVIERFRAEVERLVTVMERQLAQKEFLAGNEYTIADMGCWGWVHRMEELGVSLAPYSKVKKWYDVLGARPAVQRGIAVGA